MSGDERYVLLGVAHPRCAWFRTVGTWSQSGALAAEFVKCLSVEEARARLESARPYSALLADAGLPAVDRELLAAATSAGCAVVVVDDGRARRDWEALGAARVLPAGFTRDDLAAALAAHARVVARGATAADALLSRAGSGPGGGAWRGEVVAVTGPGGTGASTAAIALAQALSDDARQAGLVVLADLRLHAEQAMLHDAGDVTPGVQELVEAHRSGDLSAGAIRSLVFEVPARGYHLLLGLRRARHWPALRPNAFAAAFDALERSFRYVVCDVDADLEGEEDSGSADVEERNLMSRTAVRRAACVVVVGDPSMKGLHSMVRVIDEVAGAGVAAERILPALNRAPRSARARARLASALADLAEPVLGPSSALSSPVFLPERRVEEALRSSQRLPAGPGATLAGAVAAVSERAVVAGSGASGVVPERVRPGSLGRWAPEGIGG